MLCFFTALLVEMGFHTEVMCYQQQKNSIRASYVPAVIGESPLEEEHGLPSYVETGSGNSLYSCYSLSNNGTIAHVCLSLNAAPVFFPPKLCACACRAAGVFPS